MRFSSLSTLFLSASLASARAVVSRDEISLDASISNVIAPKMMIISLFGPEEAAWPEHLNFYAHNITVPGLSPLFPDVHCTADKQICQYTTGEGIINAATSTTALAYSSLFDFSETYWMIAGVAGINPNCGTLGSVSLSRYVVQVDLQYLIDPRNLTTEEAQHAGFIPLGTSDPEDYPVFIYGTEVFELNRPLLNRAFNVMQHANLTDSQQARDYSAKYPAAVTKGSPTIFKGEIAVTDAYFNGESIGNAFSYYVNSLTNGTGTYCMSAQEDSGVLESLMRAHMTKKVDFSRIVAMRIGINFERPPPGETSPQALFKDNSGGPDIAFSNVYNAGIEFVNDVVHNWSSVYQKGVAPDNYIGDILGTLKGKYPADIGSPYFQQG